MKIYDLKGSMKEGKHGFMKSGHFLLKPKYNPYTRSM